MFSTSEARSQEAMGGYGRLGNAHPVTLRQNESIAVLCSLGWSCSNSHLARGAAVLAGVLCAGCVLGVRWVFGGM